MSNPHFPKNLRVMPTFLLFILGMLTLGVFFAFYIHRQSKILNQEIKSRNLDHIRPIDDLLLKSLTIALIFLPLFNIIHWSLIVYFTNEYSFTFAIEKLVIFSMLMNFVGMAVNLMVIAWSFLVRDRFHDLFSIQKGTKLWFHGFWTFFFAILYINYKINLMEEASRISLSSSNSLTPST